MKASALSASGVYSTLTAMRVPPTRMPSRQPTRSSSTRNSSRAAPSDHPWPSRVRHVAPARYRECRASGGREAAVTATVTRGRDRSERTAASASNASGASERTICLAGESAKTTSVSVTTPRAKAPWNASDTGARPRPSSAASTMAHGSTGSSQSPIWWPSCTNGYSSMAPAPSSSRTAEMPMADSASANTGAGRRRNQNTEPASAKSARCTTQKRGDVACPSTRSRIERSRLPSGTGRPVSAFARPAGVTMSKRATRGFASSVSTAWLAAENTRDGDSNTTAWRTSGFSAWLTRIR